ncbi:hypothetical protein [Candidatus Enterococcus mansonii]|uniref:Uncharacterized protein n=1 Tax=Candidatus Enterococcus mansonii TaxID=1834181 RepID=A0A242C6H2_9ENTE|nr:hypothetical protein [Enterococcus sp. 4G2_DIV0659]OTO05791.1 hypothetical protein A5880_002966 [Enterococcus sp. 4G2_DIV0659]
MNSTPLIENKCTICGAPNDDPNAKKCSYCMMPLKKDDNSDKSEQAFLCLNCGSYLNVTNGHFDCEYCHSTFSLNEKETFDKAFFGKKEKVELNISKEEAKTSFYEWLIKNELLKEKIESFTLKQLYVPYMIATVEFEAEYSVVVGHEKWGPYIELNGIEKKRKITEWQKESDHCLASLTKSYLITKELSLDVQSFAKKIDCTEYVKQAVPFDNTNRADEQILTVSCETAESVTRIVKKYISKSAEKTVKSQLSSADAKDLTVESLKYKMNSDYLYVPFWQVLYSYEGKKYQVLITATDSSVIAIDGSKPMTEKVRKKVPKKKNQSSQTSFSFLILLLFIVAIIVLKPIRQVILAMLGLYLLGCLSSIRKKSKKQKSNLRH